MDRNDQVNLRATRIWVYAILSFTIILVIGFFGYLDTPVLRVIAQKENAVPWFSALYYSFQLVFLDAPDFFHQSLTSQNWKLIVAAFLLPLFPAFALFRLLTRIFGVQLSLIRLAFFPRKHVFLGAGRLSASVVDSLKSRDGRANKNSSILAVDINNEQANSRHIRECSQVMMLEHDVNDRHFLKTLQLHKAASIYVFTGDDTRNLEIGLKVAETLTQKNSKTVQRLIINVESPQLRSLAAENNSIKQLIKDGVDVLWLSGATHAARALINQYPPSNSVPKSLHVGVLGGSTLVHEIAAQLVKQSLIDNTSQHYPASLHITIFGNDESEYQQLLAQHPVLAAEPTDKEYGEIAPPAQVQFVKIKAAAITPKDIARALDSKNKQAFDAVYVTETNDRACVGSAFRVKQALTFHGYVDTKIIACISGDVYPNCSALLRELSADMHSVLGNVSWFHPHADAFDPYDNYPGETTELLGKYIEYAYGALFEGGIKKASEKPDLGKVKEKWLALTESFRDSNRQASDHYAVKLRYLGYVVERRSVLENLRRHLEVKAPILMRAAKDQLLNILFELINAVLIAIPTDLQKKLNELKLEGLSEKAFVSTVMSTIETYFDDDTKKQKLLEVINKDALDHIENLSVLEHERFINERLMDGWLCDQEDLRDALAGVEPKQARKKLQFNHTLVTNILIKEMDAAKKLKNNNGPTQREKDQVNSLVMKHAFQEEDIRKRFIIYRIPGDEANVDLAEFILKIGKYRNDSYQMPRLRLNRYNI